MILRAIAGAVLLVLAAGMPAGAGQVVLKKAFVEKHKDRATIDASFRIDTAHKTPNRIRDDGDDGDLHMAGRAKEVGLPMVVEMMNAALPSQKTSVELVQKKKGKDEAVSLAGAWRLWFEHPSAKVQVQGHAVAKPKDTNPAHVFEVHPVSRLAGASLEKAFVPTPGFRAYDADTAFPYYESLKATLRATQTAVTIDTKKAKYNYVEFVIALTSAVKKVGDGSFVLASVLDAEGASVVPQARRMVFVKGTDAEKALEGHVQGDRLRVLGVPRINLERVSALLSQASGDTVQAQLPYEMIVVGVFPD